MPGGSPVGTYCPGCHDGASQGWLVTLSHVASVIVGLARLGPAQLDEPNWIGTVVIASVPEAPTPPRHHSEPEAGFPPALLAVCGLN